MALRCGLFFTPSQMAIPESPARWTLTTMSAGRSATAIRKAALPSATVRTSHPRSWSVAFTDGPNGRPASARITIGARPFPVARPPAADAGKAAGESAGAGGSATGHGDATGDGVRTEVGGAAGEEAWNTLGGAATGARAGTDTTRSAGGSCGAAARGSKRWPQRVQRILAPGR